MPSDMETSRLRHQHSASSDHGRALVPMWDSSDPDRAPPPLPLNPASSPSLTSRPNTSSAIQSAHAALTEKARENSSYITNLSPERKRNESSPERSLIKGAAHKRMQSLQTGHVRDLSCFLESGNLSSSPTKSPEKASTRPSTPSPTKEARISEPETPSRAVTPTPERETPTMRSSLRRPHQSILGENTPPQSATMLALQTMAAKSLDSPLADVTNGSTALVRSPPTFDAISNQILSLTSIATSLQREMAQLSRRSKDNATDLVSLKEATNSRDEDIRKSLRELVCNLSEAPSRSSSTFSASGLLLDNKPHTPKPKAKMFSLPRIPSPTSFSASLDRDATSSPSPYNLETTAGIALLEKILRDMGTKDGQENLVQQLSEVAESLARDGVATAKKVEDLLQYIKANGGSRVPMPQQDNNGFSPRSRDLTTTDGAPQLELDFDRQSAGPMVTRVGNLLGGRANKDNINTSGTAQQTGQISEEILRIVRTVKDSVAQGGGLTAEVKALVQNLRGEVLGMGREIGRKLDHTDSQDSSIDREYLSSTINSGLEEIRKQMERAVHQAAQESSSSAISHAGVNPREIYSAVKSAIEDGQISGADTGVAKEDIIEAVREAWENYKPDIEQQHSGLEREELLSCLQEGFQQYTTQNISQENLGATREEVFTAVVEGLRHFSPPIADQGPSITREDILDAVRECLEEFEFPVAPSESLGAVGVSRDDMLDAVREGLSSFESLAGGSTVSRDVAGGLNRDEIIEAVRSGLEDLPRERSGFSQNVEERLQEVVDIMRSEFNAVSDEAKQNVAANGRDTEQVLDATKDGLERLRADIESYVDRASDVTGKDEILQSMRDSFDLLREELEPVITRGSENSINAIKEGLEQFREAMSTSMVRSGPGLDKDDILDVLRDGIEGLRAEFERPKDGSESGVSGTGEILDALQDGLNSLRHEVEKVGSKPVDMTVNYEILDTLKSGIQGLRADIDRLRESSHDERDVTAITSGAVIAAEGLKRDDIENLEVLITQLRIKVEALESLPTPSQHEPAAVSRDDLAKVQEALKEVQVALGEANFGSHSSAGDSATREDVEAIETLLRNTKAKIDEMDPAQAVKKDHLDIVEEVMRDVREGVNDVLSQLGETSKRDELNLVEALVKDVITSLVEIKEQATSDEKVSKTDIELIGSLCFDLKAQIESVVMTDLIALASKEDVMGLEESVKEIKAHMENYADLNATAFEERQAETVGVGERVTEVKTFLGELREVLSEKLESSTTSMDAMGQVLAGLEEAAGTQATDAKAFLDLVKFEFEKSHAGVVGVKLESDEQFQKTWDKFEDRFNELMIKYDDAQTAAESKAQGGSEKEAAIQAAMFSTRDVTEELKILVDTLGSTLTDSVDKMDEASRTVFNRVDETFSQVEDTRITGMAEHQSTREQVLKTLSAVEGIRGHVNDYHPKILDSLKDVLMIVGQHYEHSKTTADTLQEKIAERPTPAPVVEERQLLQDLKGPEKYDDGPVHEKLDKIVDSMHTTEKSIANLEMLDKIHAQVMQTAAEVSDFVSIQTQRIADNHEDKERAVEEATIALEKRLAQKEIAESEVARLHEDEKNLKSSITTLKDEQDSLLHQKMRLAADVSSLETALQIRREELHAMEARAEGLERRILEGVIDHSRAFLIGRNTTGSKGRDAMNLKRVPSTATSMTGSALSSISAQSRASHTTEGAVGLAMNGVRSTAPISDLLSVNPAKTSRRILSLNQITNNVPAGGFCRSQSVKAPGGNALRKSSWGGSLQRRGYGELNKENLALREDEGDDSDAISDAGTMRRMSKGGTDSTIDEGTEWTGSDVGSAPEEEGSNLVLVEAA